MHPPVLYHYHTALEANDKAFCEEQLQIIIGGADIACDLLRIVHEAVIVCPHIQVEVQCLSRERHIEEGIAVDDLLREHSLLSHQIPAFLKCSTLTTMSRVSSGLPFS